MNIEINSAKLILELIDKETGEIITREATLGDFKEVTAKKKTSTKKPKDDCPDPKAILLDGKIQLNAKAVELTGWEPDMKIDIRFKKEGRKTIPVMCEDEAKGNRLTKTFTISCRGSKRDNLSEFGTEFNVEECDGYFKLIGNAPEKEDDIIDVPEEIEDPSSFEGESDDFEDFSFDLDD